MEAKMDSWASNSISHLSLFIFIFLSLPLRLHTSSLLAMDSSDEVAIDFPPFVRLYKDGRIERLEGTDVIPPSLDPATGVSSKDVTILPESGVSARLYLPKITYPGKKLPILIYYHGGAFLVHTPFSHFYHSYLNSLVAESDVVAVSVDYRRAPEYSLPTAYDDAWAALQWTTSHATGGPEAWLSDHGNFSRIFLAGDSSGANIVHNVLMRAGNHGLSNAAKIYGGVLVHPYFWAVEASKKAKDPASKAMMELIWLLACPSSTSLDDPWLNPMAVGAPSLRGLGGKRMIVFIAEKDAVRDRGWLYYHALASSGWNGKAEMFETEGEGHVFHLINPSSEKAVALMKRLAGFLNL